MLQQQLLKLGSSYQRSQHLLALFLDGLQLEKFQWPLKVAVTGGKCTGFDDLIERF